MIHDLLFAPNNYFQGFLFFPFFDQQSQCFFFFWGGELEGKNGGRKLHGVAYGYSHL